MLRSIGAIVAGFIFIGVLAFGSDALVRSAMPGAFVNGRVEDPLVLLLTLAYVFVFATAGCWLAARLAPDRPMRHAIILGLAGLAFNIAGTVATWTTAPAWYHITALVLVMPAAWLGGRIREMQIDQHPSTVAATS